MTAQPFTATWRSAATNHTGKATPPSTKTSSCGSLSRRQVSTKRVCWRFLNRQASGYPRTIPGARAAAAHSVSFQQKIEWVRLREQHPEAFEEAKRYEKNAIDDGSPFTWSQGESLDELERPERIEQIRQDHAERLARMQSRIQSNPLRPDSEPVDIDDLYGKAKVCLACHK